MQSGGQGRTPRPASMHRAWIEPLFTSRSARRPYDFSTRHWIVQTPGEEASGLPLPRKHDCALKGVSSMYALRALLWLVVISASFCGTGPAVTAEAGDPQLTPLV